MPPLSPGEGARLTVTERAFINAWRANTINSSRTVVSLSKFVWETCGLPLIL